MTDPDDDWSFVSTALPGWADLRIVALQPGEQRVYDAGDWAGSLVAVEQGEMELETTSGRRLMLGPGAVLALAALPLRAIRNVGSDVLLLSSIAKRGPSGPPRPGSSLGTEAPADPSAPAIGREGSAGTVRTTASADGTVIAYEERGDGPPLIMVAGALSTRTTFAPLAERLARRFTVISYDRRGRGDSGDARPYAIARESEDIEALIQVVGGPAYVFGCSSGATLALTAAAGGLTLKGLALYEPPFVVDPGHRRPPADLVARLEALVAAGRRGDALELYVREALGLPGDVVVRSSAASGRPALDAIAHTVVYYAMITGDYSLPLDLLPAVALPTLVLDRADSWPPFRRGARALAERLADARSCTVDEQAHEASPGVLASVLERFFLS